MIYCTLVHAHEKNLFKFEGSGMAKHVQYAQGIAKYIKIKKLSYCNPNRETIRW